MEGIRRLVIGGIGDGMQGMDGCVPNAPFREDCLCLIVRSLCIELI